MNQFGAIVAILLVEFCFRQKTGVADGKASRELKDSQKKDTVKVVRDGVVKVIEADELVVGDTYPASVR